MRRPAKDLDLALRMSSEGMSATSIARAIGVHVSTATRWRERAATHLRRFSEEKLVVSEPTEVQLDELRVGSIGAAEGTWAWSAIEVWSRVWLASAVERRTLRATRRFLRGVEDSCTKMVLPTVFATDEFKYYAPVINKVFGPLVAHVEVKSRYANGGNARTTLKLRNTPDFRYDFARERSEDSKRPNTAYVERLNLLERRGVSYLNRRTPGRARKTRPVADALEILRAYYNFIKPQVSLRFGRVTRTPAMQAGCAKKPLTFGDMLRWLPPAQRRLKRVVMDLTQTRRRPSVEIS
jgi:transposase-like protein